MGRKRWMSTTDAVNYVIDEARSNRMLLGEGQRLLEALGHGDCVSREHQKAEYEVRSAYLAERDEAVARAERAERELERVKQEKAGMTNRAYRILPNDDTDGHSGETWREFAADEGMARIEVERERDALKADNDRLREALRDAVTWIEVVPGSSWLHDKQGLLRRARAALSAYAEPCDCEPIRYPLHLSNSWTYTWEHQPDCATQRKES